MGGGGWGMGQMLVGMKKAVGGGYDIRITQPEGDDAIKLIKHIQHG